jgi:hypothetical protein
MTTITSALTRLIGLCVGITLSISALALAAQRPSVVVHDDDITIRGCIGRVPSGYVAAQPALVWTRSDIMLMNAIAIQAGQPAPLTERVFYWLEDGDDLSKHLGQMVEVKGDLGDFKKGELEIKRDGEFTNIELKLGGKTDRARLPTAWLGAPAGEGEFDIVSRKIDVDDVKVLGACAVR